MTILRIKIAVLLLLCSLAGARAQVRPDQFPIQTNIEGANFEIYSQYNGVNTKTLPVYMKEYFVPNVDSAWQAFTFTDSTGVADSLRMMFLKDNQGRVWYVDADGDALLLKDTAQAVGNVYVLATTSDTTTVSSPVEGDIAYVQDTARLLVYEAYWLVFSGGGGSGSTTFERFEISGDTLYAAITGDAVPDLFVELSPYLDNTDDQTVSFDTLTGQFSIESGNTIDLTGLFAKGQGTGGTIPIWSEWDSLGNSAITQSGQEIAMGLTGALTVPTGTDAEVPVWGNGKLRYNTTSGGFQGGASGYYLPYSNTPNFSSGSIPYSNGVRLLEDAGLFYEPGTDELRIGGNADAGNYDLQLNGHGIYVYSAFPALYIRQGRIEFENNQPVSIDANPVNFTGTFFDVQHLSTNYASFAAKIFGRSWPLVVANPVGSTTGRYPLHVGYDRTTINYPQKAIVISNAETPALDPTNGSGVNVGGSLDLSWEYKKDGAPDYRYEAAKISPKVIDYTQGAVDVSLDFYTIINNVLTKVIGADSSGVNLNQYGAGNITGTPTASSVSVQSDGKIIERAFAYAEMFIDDINPDTISITAGTPAEGTDWTAGEFANFTYSAGRLTYAGTETAKFHIHYSSSITHSVNSTNIEAWVYENGSEVAKSHSIGTVITAGNIVPISHSCIVELSTNDYIELFYDASNGGDVVVYTSSITIEKI